MTIKKCLFLVIGALLFAIFPSRSLASTVDLSDTNNFNIRYDGNSGENLGNSKPVVTDINNDGLVDMVIAGPAGNYLYIIYNSLLSEITGKGNVINLSDPTNYNIRYTGSGMMLVGGFMSHVADINNDNSVDLIIPSIGSGNNSRMFSGSVYLIYSSLFSSYSGTGNNVDLTNSANYSKRFDGASMTNFLGQVIDIADFDNDGKYDLAISSDSSNNGRGSSGSVYVIYNSLISSLVSKNVDLNTSSNYSIRFDGSAAGDGLGRIGIKSGDVNGDGEQDLLLGANGSSNNSRAASGSLFIIYNSLISRFSSTGNTVDMATGSNYNIRLDGASENGSFGNESLEIVDVNNNGLVDLIVGAYESDYNSRTDSGSLYLFYDSIISEYSGTGNNVDLAVSTNYNVRFDGSHQDFKLGTGVDVVDFDNDGKNDILAHSTTAGYNSRSSSGSLYYINNLLFSSLDITGQNIDSLNTANFSTRFDGAIATGQFADVGGKMSDLNQDGKIDIIMGAPFTDFNGKTNNGSYYIIYNFPHTISVTNTSTNTDTAVISGTVTTIDSVTPVHGVQYSLDTNSPSGGNWKNCSGTTSFSCTIPKSGGTTHTVYLRAFDTNTSYTARQNYAATNFAYNTTAGNNSSTSCTTTLNTNLTPSITNLKPLNNNTSVELTLQNNDTNATEYIIEYGTTKTNLNYSALNIPTTTKTYTINKLNPTKQYYFRVRTTNGCGFGNWSATVKNENVEVNNLETTPLHSITQNSAGQAKTKLETQNNFEEQNSTKPETSSDREANGNLIKSILNWLSTFFKDIFN